MLYQSKRFSEKAPTMINLQMLLALGGGLLAAVQALLIVLERDILCLNDGCEIVEKLTTVPPIAFNVAGNLFFMTVFLALWQGSRGVRGWFNLARVLLLAGIAVEGVLVGFQYYVAEVFCSYCLIIFSIVAALNLLMGWGQILGAATVFGAVLLGFSSLHFTPHSESEVMELDKGSYGRLEKTKNGNGLYLFFSSTCPHCEDIIATIGPGFECSLDFNPIDEVKVTPLNGLVLNPAYSPAINRKFLKAIGVSEIPTLVVKGEREIRILKGKKMIEEYLDDRCRDTAGSDNSSSGVSGIVGQSTGFSVFSAVPKDDACTVEEACEEETAAKNGQ